MGASFRTLFSGLIRIAASEVKPGDSGAPIFNHEGEVVAVVSEHGSTLGSDLFATPINLGANLLDMAGINDQRVKEIEEIEAVIEELRRKIAWTVELNNCSKKVCS